jgi:Cu-Zn family superoxide dismutase
MHEGADDYQTDPAGAAGARIACGVVEQQQQ